MIHVNFKTLLMASLISTFASGLDLQASAQGVKVDKNALEKVRWHQAPRQIQILDDRPVIRDFRTADVSGNAAGGSPGLPSSGAGSGPLGGVTLSGLPKVGFGPSNIPASGLAPNKALPSGKSTNVLAKKFPARKAVPSKLQKIQKTAPAALPSTTILTYKDTAISAPASRSSLLTQTSVKGQIKKRGNLLQ